MYELYSLEMVSYWQAASHTGPSGALHDVGHTLPLTARKTWMPCYVGTNGLRGALVGWVNHNHTDA